MESSSPSLQNIHIYPLSLSLFIQAHSFVTENIISFTYYPLFILLKHTFKWLKFPISASIGPSFKRSYLFYIRLCFVEEQASLNRIFYASLRFRSVFPLVRFLPARILTKLNDIFLSLVGVAIDTLVFATCFYIALHSTVLFQIGWWCGTIATVLKHYAHIYNMKTDGRELFCPLYQLY